MPRAKELLDGFLSEVAVARADIHHEGVRAFSLLRHRLSYTLIHRLANKVFDGFSRRYGGSLTHGFGFLWELCGKMWDFQGKFVRISN